MHEGSGVGRSKLLAAAAVITTAAALVAVPLGSAARAAAGRTTLPGSMPAWATPANLAGTPAATDPVGFRVYLPWRGGDAAAQALAVSTPGDAAYRHFLTPGQFRSAYAPDNSTVAAVQRWLQNAGLTVDYVPSNNLYIAAEGTVSQVEAAFATSLRLYKVAGQTLRAPSSPPSLPAGLPSVAAVVGLDDSGRLVHPQAASGSPSGRPGDPDAPPTAGYRAGQPCSAYYGEQTATAPPFEGRTTFPVAVCGYAPNQIQAAYGLSDPIAAGHDGTGQTIAIIDAFASPTIEADVAQYSQRHGLPAFKPGQFTQVVAPGTFRTPNNPAMDPSGWYGEETLDVEAVHTTAPGAKIVYVSAPNNYQDLDAALNHVVDRHLAQIVSNSYGWSTELLPPGFEIAFDNIAVQAALTGVGLYFSSGDDGDELADMGYRTADWPASSRWVTAVGGTSLAIGSGGQHLFETGWETGRAPIANFGTPQAKYVGPLDPPAFFGGAGGGTSRIVPEPAYQQGVVPDVLAHYFSSSFAGRVVPDIAAVGDPNTGFLVGQTQTFSDGTYYDEYRIGGTSLACPLIAGMMAIADQYAGAPHGFANPAVYALKRAGGRGLYDVVQSPTGQQEAELRANYVNNENASDGLAWSLRTLDYPGETTLASRPGYDDITGVGTPTGVGFLSRV